MVIRKRPTLANIKWREGGAFSNGKYVGGIENSVWLPARVQEMVNLELTLEGRKVAVKYKVFVSGLTLSETDLKTLQISFNGITQKILLAVLKQSHLKIYL